MFGSTPKRVAVLPLLALLLSVSSPVMAQQQIECDDVDLQSYLLALIDVLYANGLTIWEDLVAHMSQNDPGYNYLESLYTADQVTLLVPTDAAMQNAGIWSPFGNQNDTYLSHLAQLHSLHGQVTFDSLPAAPLKGVASSFLSVQDHMGSDVDSKAMQAVSLIKDPQGATIDVLSVYGDATTWDGKLDLSKFPALDNIVILPIDQLLPFPPKLGEALQEPITADAGGDKSLTLLATAFKAVAPQTGTTSLEALTTAGFTIFAPADEALNADVMKQINDPVTAPKLLANHYATNYTLFSAAWTGSGSFNNFSVASGQNLQVVYNGTGNYVIMGGQTAKIVATDIVLENGVMHVIDKALLVEQPGVTASENAPPTLVASPPGASHTGGSTTPSASTSAGNNGQLSSTSGSNAVLAPVGLVASLMLGAVLLLSL